MADSKAEFLLIASLPTCLMCCLSMGMVAAGVCTQHVMVKVIAKFQSALEDTTSCLLREPEKGLARTEIGLLSVWGKGVPPDWTTSNRLRGLFR